MKERQLTAMCQLAIPTTAAPLTGSCRRRTRVHLPPDDHLSSRELLTIDLFRKRLPARRHETKRAVNLQGQRC